MLARLTAYLSASEGVVRRLLIASVAIGFACLLAAALAAAWLTARSAEHGRWVNHTYDVEVAVDRARIAIEQSETLRRGYLLSGQSAYLDAYRETVAGVPSAVARVATLTRDNAGQQARIVVLRARLADLFAQRTRTIALVAAGRRADAAAEFAGEVGFRRMRGVRETFDALTAEEQRLLVIRDRDLRGSVAGFFVALALAGLLLVLVTAATLLTVLRYTRDLGRSRADLARLNDTLEDQVRTRTADLSRANEEVQRFAYIVSHDLRSPLVNVMGFTSELDAATKSITQLIDRAEAEAPAIVTREVALAAREDLPEAIAFIRASTAKMDRLINAILKLSREGRRVLSPEAIDMTALVAGIRDSLAHIADERGVEIVVEPLPALVCDRVAVEQIFSNLVENATKYLADDRAARVVVGGTRDGMRGIFTVTDNGRGIDAKDHARIFDLFRRSGRQDTAGEGIGLAHARALAIRLGGMIEVESRLGDGATFRVTLPAEPIAGDIAA